MPCRDCPELGEEDMDMFINPCKKIENLIDNTPNLKEKLIELEEKTSDTIEHGIYKYTNTTQVLNMPSGVDSEIGYDVPANATFEFLAHTHNSPANTTLSIFSPTDLQTLADLLKKNRIKNSKFINYVITADSTRYAMVINSKSKFLRFMAGNSDPNFDPEYAIKYAIAFNEYYDAFNEADIDPLIDYDHTPEDNLKHFLSMLQDNDMGLKLYEVDSEYETYKELTYNKTTQEIDKEPCP